MINLTSAALDVLENEPRFYLASLKRQFELLRSHIHGVVLDIGCGLAGVDAAAAAAGLARVFHLLDGDGTGPKVQRFSVRPPIPWNDVAVGADVVKLNARSGVEVHIWPPDPTATIGPCDVILSLRSWGHHYAVGVYAELARRSLSPGGRIIMDIRRGTGGITDMQEAGFKIVGIIPDPSMKCDRFIFARRNEKI